MQAHSQQRGDTGNRTDKAPHSPGGQDQQGEVSIEPICRAGVEMGGSLTKQEWRGAL